MNIVSQTSPQTDLNHDYAKAFSAEAFSSRKLWSIIHGLNGSNLDKELHKCIAASEELIRRKEYSVETCFYKIEST